MKKVFIISILTIFSTCTIIGCEKNKALKEFELKDICPIQYGFIPINNEDIRKYDNQDICEIFWGEELQCENGNITPDLGKTPSSSPDNK